MRSDAPTLFKTNILDFPFPISDVCTPGGGGYFRNFWVGMCHWDPGTLNLYQS